MTSRPPLPPFTQETAVQKVRLAEDGWNSRNPQKVSLAYTVDSHWRNRAEFLNGREQIVAFLPGNGRGNSTTGSSRSCGRLPATVSRCVSRMNTTTTQGTGFALTEMRIGSSMTRV